MGVGLPVHQALQQLVSPQTVALSYFVQAFDFESGLAVFNGMQALLG